MGLDSVYLRTLRTIGIAAILSAFSAATTAVGQLKQQSPTYVSTTNLVEPKAHTSSDNELNPDELVIFSKEYLANLERSKRGLEYNLNSSSGTDSNNTLRIDRIKEIHSPLQIETSPPKFDSKGDAGRYAGQAVADKIGFAMPYINAPLGNGWSVGSKSSHSQFKLSAGLRGLYQPVIKLDYKNAVFNNLDVKLRSRWEKPAEFSIVKKLGKVKDGELQNEVGIYTDLEKDGGFNSYLIFQTDWDWFKNKLRR